MSFARRLMGLFLALAFTGYGLIAAAPAHAHRHHGHGEHALHTVALDAVADDHHDHHSADLQDAHDHHDNGLREDTAPAEHGGLHVHALASFTTVSGSPTLPEPVSSAVMNLVDHSTVRVSGLFAPLKKPPRSVL